MLRSKARLSHDGRAFRFFVIVLLVVGVGTRVDFRLEAVALI
jgi:hypothetical protein